MPDQNTPFACKIEKVRDEWIDYNGHFNMGYYGALFDITADDAFKVMGLGPDYVDTGFSFYTLEAHITYLRELHAGDAVQVHFRILDYDAKRIHYFEEMYHAEGGWLAATLEGICMHIDMDAKKSCSFPDDVLKEIAAMHSAHQDLAVPPQVGHKIGIVRKMA
ncbi:MAG: thioesterase family protein [Hyphomicrobiales bacterium]|nr:thioesterase family protein [Hyphomicrobiales bacterium]